MLPAPTVYAMCPSLWLAVEMSTCVLQSDESSTSSDESDKELPYGGDMQRAVQAQDRDAIRTLMAARKGSKKSGKKVRDPYVEQRHVSLLSNVVIVLAWGSLRLEKRISPATYKLRLRPLITAGPPHLTASALVRPYIRESAQRQLCYLWEQPSGPE